MMPLASFVHEDSWSMLEGYDGADLLFEISISEWGAPPIFDLTYGGDPGWGPEYEIDFVFIKHDGGWHPVESKTILEVMYASDTWKYIEERIYEGIEGLER